jgi:putative transposase
MSRPYRIEIEDGIYHVYSRGNRRGDIFENEKDKRRLLEFLVRGKEKYRYHILGYVLMTNHYHFLIQTIKANLSRIMHYVNSSYATYYNYTHRKSGHLFQGRYKAILVDHDEYYKKITAYVHNNPVRAGIVDHPEEYGWSSYKGYIRRRGDGVIDKRIVDRYLGMSSGEYEGYVVSELKENNEKLKQIYAGSILGRPKFIKDVLADVKTKIEGEDYSFRSGINIDSESNGICVENIVKSISVLYSIGEDEIFNGTKKKMIERKIAVYLSKILTGKTNKEIGVRFGISHTGVSKVFSRIEQDIKENGILKKRIDQVLSHVKG